jgi:hypothetical protein
MFISCEWNAGQNCKLKVADKTFKNVAVFESLGTT